MNEDVIKPSEQPLNGTNMIDNSFGGGLGASGSSAPPIPQKPEPITQRPETNSTKDKQ